MVTMTLCGANSVIVHYFLKKGGATGLGGATGHDAGNHHVNVGSTRNTSKDQLLTAN